MIRSKYGFYIGDVYNVLDKYYLDQWRDGNYGESNDEDVQEVKVHPADMGIIPSKQAYENCNVFGVAFDIRDGTYTDQYDNEYKVGRGVYSEPANIGVVPLELCDRNKLNNNNGSFIAGGGTASINKKGTMVIIRINDIKTFIDTECAYDEDDWPWPGYDE